MIRARCIRACTWLGKYWAVGAVYEGTQTPPRHFVTLEDKPDEPSPGGNCGCGPDCDCGTEDVEFATDDEVNEMLDAVGI